MVGDFEGWVLRKPRVAPSNSAFTAEGDVVVRGVDEAAYRAAYLDNLSATRSEYLVRVTGTNDLVVPSSITEQASQITTTTFQFNAQGRAIEDVSVFDVTPTPDAVDSQAGIITYNSAPVGVVTVTYTPKPLLLEFTRNDTRTRFGYDDRVQRWSPLPGSAPESLGDLQEDGLLSLPTLDEETPPRVILGDPDSTIGQEVSIPPANLVSNAVFTQYLDGILSVSAGEGVVNLETGQLLVANDLILTYEGQAAFFTREDFFTFDASTGAVGNINASDRLYLNPLPLADEIPLLRVGYGSYLPPSEYTITLATGEITLTSPGSYEGETLYYDGVLLDTDIEPYAPALVGVLGGALSTVDLSVYEPESLILYLDKDSQALAIESVAFVETSADFTAARNLPANRAEIALDTGEVNVSGPLLRQQQGSTLRVATSDYPLERGISFRMARTSVDLTNENNVPDGQGTLRVNDELLQGAVNAGPSQPLTQVPLTNVAGYATDVFYRLQKGATRRLLIPDEDVIYDFDNRQLLWAERRTFNQTITQTSYDLRLPDQVLLDRNYTLELNAGAGYQPLEPGEDVILDFDTGTAQLVTVRGSVLVSDVARITGQTFTLLTEDPTSVSIPSDPRLRPLLRAGNDVFVISQISGQDVTVTGAVDLTGSVAVEILEAPEITYLYALDDTSLAPQIVYPHLVQSVDAQATVYAPEGVSLEVYADGASRAVSVLSDQLLGGVGDTLTLPASAQIPEANFRLYREEVELSFTAGVPGPDEYALSGATVVLNAQDLLDHVGLPVAFSPQLSSPRATGNVELLSSNRQLGFPLDVQNASEVLLYVGISPEAFTLNRKLLYFERPFRDEERLVVRYQSEPNGAVIEESVGFNVVETTTGSFGAGRTIDTSRPAFALVNGAPANLTVNTTQKTVNVSGVRAGRRVSVNYYALDAEGGEQNVSLLQTPVAPDVVLVPGTTQQILGDLTGILSANTFVQASDVSFSISGTPTFDGTYTNFEISPGLADTLYNPTTFVSETSLTFENLPGVASQVTSAGEREVRFFGDVTSSIQAQHVLTLNGDPYYIQEVTLEVSQGLTRVVTGSRLQSYTNPSVAVSDYPVYGPDPSTLLVEAIGRDDLDYQLIRVDGLEAEIIPREAYLYEPAGRITLDPTQVELPKGGEIWYFAYTGIDPVSPSEIGGQIFFPRFRATYTRRVNATEANGFLNAQLLATYTLRVPDTFYFRVLPLEEYVAEVAEELNIQAASSAPSGGPILSLGGSSELYQQGQETLTWEGGDLYDQDRASRQFLAYYNALCTAFENLQEVVDGRVIGARDGKFRFTLRTPNTPGGVDEITGRLVPYFINESNPGIKPTSAEILTANLEGQGGRVLNDIDDLILVSKRPYALDLAVPPDFVFQGTFKAAWEPSKYSRLYPEERKIRTVTLPPLGGGPDYTLSDDFGQLLADLGVEGVLAVRNLAPRGAAATVTAFVENATTVEITAAQTYDSLTGELSNTPYDLTTGDPSRTRPPFEVGKHVTIARVSYTRVGEIITRTETIIATDLIVDAVTSDTLTLSEGNGTTIGTFTAQAGDTVYVQPALNLAGVPDLTALDPEDMPFYRPPLDVFVNEADGELLNPIVPDFFVDLLGQKVPPPGTYLEADVNFKNRNTTPTRFPALDGEGVNDDGDVNPPFVSPLPSSELQRLPSELTAINTLLTETSEGAFAGVSAKIDPSLLSTTEDLSGAGIAPFDYVLLEGDQLYAASQAGANTLTLAAFRYRDPAAAYDVPNLYQGAGTVVGSTLTDGGTDFTSFSGATITLNIDGGGSYAVQTLANGSLTTVNPIVETGAQTYTLSASGIGSISADLRALEDPGVDFSGATGTFTITPPGAGVVTFTIDEGGLNILYPETVSDGFSAPVAVSPAQDIATGLGAVVLGTQTLETADSLAGVRVGDVLMVDPDSPNAGRYRISSVQPGEVVIDVGADPGIWETSFYVVEGDSGISDYPASWRIVRPRRYSLELEAYQTELANQRIVYEDNANADADLLPYLTGVSNNPSSPYKERVDQLVTLLLDAPYLSVTGEAVFLGQTLDGVDFVVEGVEVGDIVRIETGVNRGFYAVTQVTSAAITVDGTSDFVTYSLQDDPATSYTITKADQFQLRTYQLALSEQYGVVDLISRLDESLRTTFTDINDLFGTSPFGNLTGDPLDSTLNTHILSIQDRLDRIRDVQPTLTQDIEGILKGAEALYDLRFSWIDFRTNLETGSLARIRQYNASISKRRAKLRQDLLRLLATT